MTKELDRSLFGRWVIDPTDAAGIARFGQTSLEFTPEGTLLYVIHSEDTEQQIHLTYLVDGGAIVTDQPSSPRVERTPYRIEGGKLVLEHASGSASYIRPGAPELPSLRPRGR